MLDAELIPHYLDRLPVEKKLERQWLTTFLTLLEVIHLRAFGETGIREQAFVVPGTSRWLAQYLLPVSARAKLGTKISRGRCAYLVSLRGWSGRLNMWAEVLPARADPSDSARFDALLCAVHECRHRAQLRRNGVQLFAAPKRLVNALRQHFAVEVGGDNQIMQWFGVWARWGGRCGISAERRYEVDARLIEGAVPWLCAKPAQVKVEQLPESLSSLVLLGSR